MRRTGRGARATSPRRPEAGALGRGGPAPQPSHDRPRSKLAAALHLVATPIGNAGDLSPRALATLRDADVVACEDTRVTGRLLRLHGVARPLVAYHDHNAERVRPELLARLAAGASVALASDAGTPLVSDPGYKLVRAAIEAGIAVLAVPGPSAALAALTVSGLPPDRFLFAGFLPVKAEARRRAIGELAAVPATLVLFESARRLPAALADLAAALGPRREAAVARELTKLFEEVRRGRLEELAAHFAAAGPPKGEVVVVIGPPPSPAGAAAEAAVGDDGTEVERALERALRDMSPAAAASTVAAATGRPRREVYRRALALRRERR